MIFSIVVAGPPAKVRPFVGRLGPALDHSRILDGPIVEQVAPSGAWAVAAVSVPDALSAQRLVVDGDSLLVCNGPVLPDATASGNLARDTLARYDAGGSGAAASGLEGAYNVVA
jgi:hypothetical protein